MNANIGETITTMTRCVCEAAVEVFACYGVIVRPVNAASHAAVSLEPASVRAVIGYDGSGVRGALVVMAPRSAVKCWALQARFAEEIGVHEIVAELANIIMGRLKGRLLLEGFPLLMWTATPSSGMPTHLVEAQRASALANLVGPGGHFAMRLDAMFDKSFALLPYAARHSAPAAGEVLFL